jgi:hypothetical protein
MPAPDNYHVEHRGTTGLHSVPAKAQQQELGKAEKHERDGVQQLKDRMSD